MTANKSSSIKTSASFEDVQHFVKSTLKGRGDSLRRLVEGHISQAFYYENLGGEQLVLRISTQDQGFLADKYAFKTFFSNDLPIPKIHIVGDFDENAFYCVSDFSPGVSSDKLNTEQMENSINAQLTCFNEIYKWDTSATTGWGDVNINSGNGEYITWKDSVKSCVDRLDEKVLKQGLRSLGMADELFDSFRSEFYDNLALLDIPKRRLLHGDLGFDNILVENNKVAAVLDWSSVSYGDWVFDYSSLGFWWEGRYPSPKEFGEKFHLDCKNLDKRIECSTARDVLTTLEFGIKCESAGTLQWLKEYLSSRNT